jgi:DNA-binding MltR family transcriptional regulator
MEEYTMAKTMEALNNWFKKWSGLAGALAALIVALGVIYAFTGKIKDWAFDDIYDQLYTIQNNDFKHNDLYHQYSRKKDDLILDYLAGVISQANILTKRAEIESWYAEQMEALLKLPTDRKKAK